VYLFAALRFIEDENISDRVYWYLSERTCSAGELVLAPVGARSRLQLARVERTLSCEAQDAPYDMRLIKRVEAAYGERRPVFGGMPCTEFGGLKYDGKRYTRFRRILVAEDCPPYSQETERELRAYGAETFICADGQDGQERLARAEGCALFYGAQAKQKAKAVLSAVRGEPCGISEDTAELFRNKLR